MSIAILRQNVKLYVNELFLRSNLQELPFHNLARTSEIVNNVKTIANFYQLGEHDSNLLETAAWFCNTGYLVEGRHAKNSSEVAHAFLQKHDFNLEDIRVILSAIEVANELKKPAGLVEEILHDAVTYYYGTETFKSLNKLRAKEYELSISENHPEKAWNTIALEKLEHHTYYTEYCKNLLIKEKESNIKRLRKKKKEKIDVVLKQEIKETAPVSDAEKQAEPIVKQPKEKQPVRGIEMMFRVSSTNNIRVSIMADSKAHIMITVNSIIVSVLFGLAIKNIDSHPQFIIPSIILLGVNISTIIYSVLATRPGVSPGVFTEEQVENKSVNMLFYGSFYNMEFEEYKSAMKKVMVDSDFMYGCLIKDLFWQGKVLGRKYNLLRKAYTIFLYGLVVSVVAFLIAGLFFS
jgi:hypothetical protein